MTRQLDEQEVAAPGRVEIVEAERLHGFPGRIRQMIEWRAYNLFENRHHRHGQDLWDWLTAERELTFSPLITPSDSEERFTLFVEVPGFMEQHLKIAFTPNSVIIAGEREGVAQGAGGGNVYDESARKRFLFQMIELPEGVDRSGATAQLDHGILIIELPKRRYYY